MSIHTLNILYMQISSSRSLDVCFDVIVLVPLFIQPWYDFTTLISVFILVWGSASSTPQHRFFADNLFLRCFFIHIQASESSPYVVFFISGSAVSLEKIWESTQRASKDRNSIYRPPRLWCLLLIQFWNADCINTFPQVSFWIRC